MGHIYIALGKDMSFYSFPAEQAPPRPRTPTKE